MLLERIRFWLYRRARNSHPDVWRITTDMKDACMDAGINDELHRFWKLNPGVWPEKYLNGDEWIPENAKRACWLGLSSVAGPTKKVLDLGCGCGWFMLAAKACGHDVVGVDLDDVPLYNAAVRALRLDRVVMRIEPHTSGNLPKADIVTSWMTTFHDGWDCDDWAMFLGALSARRIVIELADTSLPWGEAASDLVMAAQDAGLRWSCPAPNMVDLRQ